MLSLVAVYQLQLTIVTGSCVSWQTIPSNMAGAVTKNAHRAVCIQGVAKNNPTPKV